ncbi:hypothetical protein CEXT_787991 [Caerostris extrusa]|uniref:Uncharacterized protein n=1 Tax=Caerostris extrusa TaxID=172846 RepID=A0AAV4NMY7_CAEEX|nr:hypothetical protein CEXT_787991 [Caerostris extrusa]
MKQGIFLRTQINSFNSEAIQNIWRAEAERAAEINNNILSPRWPKTHPVTLSYSKSSARFYSTEKPVDCSIRFPFLITLKAFSENGNGHHSKAFNY